jgi:hypothetical protein
MIEIACDESGYEGEKLIGTTTDVFAHGSVRLSRETAAAMLRELRLRIRSPATEYKANHLLREKHRDVLRWVLSPESPLHGNGRVFLVEKEFFVVVRLLDGTDADPAAVYRAGRALGPEEWTAFLTAANDRLRTRQPEPDIAALSPLIRDLPPAGGGSDPLVPAIVAAVRGWDGGGPVAIVHDRQRALTAARIAQVRASAPRLRSLVLAASGSDPRIQAADILAGTARKIASDELNGRGDPELTALLRPYADPSSIWGDDRSRDALRLAGPCR